MNNQKPSTKVYIKIPLNENLSELEKNLKIEFKNQELLKLALVHRSFINENKSFKEHNERLEFLGDAILEFVITEFLYKKFPKKPEGELTSLRAALVNTQALSGVAKKLNLNDFLYLSKGEAQDTSKARDAILADALEAVIGAIYLDQGIEKAKEFILQNIASRIDEVIEKKLYLDPKSALQEISQEKLGITPRYEVVSESGPDHKKIFEVQVILGESREEKGKGTNKQEAERAAARKTLEKKNWI